MAESELAALAAPTSRGRVASTAFILAMVTHWRTLMPSGQALVQQRAAIAGTKPLLQIVGRRLAARQS